MKLKLERIDELFADFYYRLIWLCSTLFRKVLVAMLGSSKGGTLLKRMGMASTSSVERKILGALHLLGRPLLFSAFGSLYVCRLEDVKMLRRSYEGKLTSYLMSEVKSGDVFMDIGVSIGRYTIMMSKIAERVISIEPEPTNFHILEASVKANRRSNILAIRVAAGNEDSEVPLVLTKEHSGGHYIVPGDGRRFGTIMVPCRKVDTLIKLHKITKLDWVKIDVEGAESMVLKGMNDTLRTLSPTIVMEVHAHQIKEVEEVLNRSGYDFYPLYVSRFDRRVYLLARPRAEH